MHVWSGVKSRRLVVLLTVVAAFIGTTHSSAGQARRFDAQIDGVAEVFGSTCPFGDWVPEEPTLCEDWMVHLFKESEPKRHNDAPWGLFVFRALSRVNPDGTVDTLWEKWGMTFDLEESSFDERRLRFASVRASVPMSDGSTADVDVTWDGSDAPLQVAGNSGPYHFNNGIDRHVVDRCFTTNNNFQQTYRAGPEVAIAGTIDGTDVQNIPYFNFFQPFLGRGHVIHVEIVHGSCD